MTASLDPYDTVLEIERDFKHDRISKQDYKQLMAKARRVGLPRA